MVAQMVMRMLKGTDKRCLWKFVWLFGIQGALSIERFKRRARRGEHFPAYLYISVINSCNLRCQGCWVDVEAPREMIDAAEMDRLIDDAHRHGNRFFGLLGGEPFMHPDLLDIMARHPDCYFQVFTNGQFITEKVAARLRELGNVSPLVSVEGREMVSDARRGGKQVLSRTMKGLENCLAAGLVTGVATSVCQTNIEDLLTEDWLRELMRRGVHYAWYHGYRPVGPKPNLDLALRPDQLTRVRRFVTEMRAKLPIAIVDAYYDHDGKALCPMVTGISHHISPRGEIEPCPIIQFAVENIRDKRGVYETMRDSAFLRDFRETTAKATRGCIVLERPDLVAELAKRHGARDSTARGTSMAEVRAMQPRFSQWLPGEEIPERHWAYRLAKRFFFYDFGAYQGREESLKAEAAKVRSRMKGKEGGEEVALAKGVPSGRINGSTDHHST